MQSIRSYFIKSEYFYESSFIPDIFFNDLEINIDGCNANDTFVEMWWISNDGTTPYDLSG